MTEDMRQIDVEFTMILKAIDWADTEKRTDTLIEFVMLLVLTWTAGAFTKNA